MSKTEIRENLCLKEEKKCICSPRTGLSDLQEPLMRGESRLHTHKGSRICGANMTLGFNSNSFGQWKRTEVAGLGSKRDVWLS